LTEAAETDLAEIWSYLAVESSEAVATNFLARLRSTFDPVREFPFAGPMRDELAPGLRVLFQTPYAIYYLVCDDELVIVRVVHGARDVAAMAGRGEFQ
jgi:toxin ParE1/3/4